MCTLLTRLHGDLPSGWESKIRRVLPIEAAPPLGTGLVRAVAIFRMVSRTSSHHCELIKMKGLQAVAISGRSPSRPFRPMVATHWLAWERIIRVGNAGNASEKPLFRPHLSALSL